MMSTDESPAFKGFSDANQMITIDCPVHWKMEVDQSHPLSVEFHSPELNQTGLLVIASPVRIDRSLFASDAQVIEFLGKVLEGAGVESGEASRLLYYPSYAAKLKNGARSWATLHEDLLIVLECRSPQDREHIYRPLFDRMLTSFRIHRSKEGAQLRLLNDVARQLKEQLPSSELQVLSDRIKLDQFEIGVYNLAASIDKNPSLRTQLIKEFVDVIVQKFAGQQSIGQESWEDVKDNIYPMIRADSILRALAGDEGNQTSGAIGQSRQVVSMPWLADLVVCYAVDTPATIRMISHFDLNRWGKDVAELNDQAMHNLQSGEFPNCTAVPGPDGKLMLCGFGEGGISSKSSYLLHPELFKRLRPQFSADIWAAIPNRDSLIIFSSHCNDRATLLKAVAEDYKTSDHSITDRLFEITPDGIVLA